MSARSSILRLAVAPEPEGLNLSRAGVPLATADPPSCQLCFGTGMEVVAGKGARRCLCRSRDAQAKLLEGARIPRRFAECSLSNYRPASNNGSQLHAFNLAYRLVREYPAIDLGLLLTGPCGVGKTHLAAAVIRGLVERGVPCLFYEFGALLKQIRSPTTRSRGRRRRRCSRPSSKLKCWSLTNWARRSRRIG